MGGSNSGSLVFSITNSSVNTQSITVTRYRGDLVVQADLVELGVMVAQHPVAQELRVLMEVLVDMGVTQLRYTIISYMEQINY